MKMKNKRGNVYLAIGIVVIIILILGGIFLIYNLKKASEDLEKSKTSEREIQEKVILKCEIDQDCEDGNSCTINSCSGKKCIENEVLLCYNNDDCCPYNCDSSNDNDCLRLE
jgi:uncharacterized protein YpmB